MKLGFIGLGQMGQGMAGNLVKAGHEVSVYNRSADKAAPLVALGARLAHTPAEAARGAEAVVTMVADDKALEAVVFGPSGFLSALAAGAVHVSASTISVAMAEKLTEAHGSAGQNFVSAPVFGRPDAAAAAKLFVAAAGAPEALARVQPVFAAIGQRTFLLSDQPASANLVKLSGNFLIAAVIEALGEAVALVAKGGIEPEAYVELLTSTLFSAPVYKTYGGLIAAQTFSPAGFAAPLGQKDVRLVLAAAESLNVPLPLASLLRDRFLALLAQPGAAELDWSAISTLARRDSGQ
ncbi:NAD(P)-dependent oxidoreductase [Acidocella sp.]|uniref:NAD(P)-dependent oxidoreductase n=1 Tax=Acidocella sp. TaxID=50710 RepID=UPI00260886DD|nr:NAD(P)-dependent oxidoreductase [Acidocella sp.]